MNQDPQPQNITPVPAPDMQPAAAAPSVGNDVSTVPAAPPVAPAAVMPAAPAPAPAATLAAPAASPAVSAKANDRHGPNAALIVGIIIGLTLAIISFFAWKQSNGAAAQTPVKTTSTITSRL